MDDLHLEGDLYLGFASFAYYVKTKHGYSLFRSGNDHLALTGDGVCFHFELTLQGSNIECGYVYVNSGDWGRIFGENIELGRDLSEKCQRWKGRLPIGANDWHCHIEPSLWGVIRTTIDDSKIAVKCIHSPQTPE